jgi:diaminopimelate epimerase
MKQSKATKTLPFCKMHTLGNDFVILDTIQNPNITLNPQTLQKLGNRNTGIGFDQLLCLSLHPNGFKTTIYNQDASQAANCGNGLLALAHYCLKYHLPNQTPSFFIYHNNTQTEAHNHNNQITLNMGQAKQMQQLTLPQELNPNPNQTQPNPIIHLGNQHLIIKCHNLNQKQLEQIGLYCHNNQEKNLNVHLVKQENPTTLSILSYERGVGITLACGSGACAAAFTTLNQNANNQTIKINSQLGTSTVSLKQNNLWLQATSNFCYNGLYPLKQPTTCAV